MRSLKLSLKRRMMHNVMGVRRSGRGGGGDDRRWVSRRALFYKRPCAVHGISSFAFFLFLLKNKN